MNKRKSTAEGASGKGHVAPPSASHASTRMHAFREVVESVVVAFLLAFLFRTFEAEAFIIPTGSMAPTLQGRHKDVVCPKCNFRYRASASQELEEDVSYAEGPAYLSEEQRRQEERYRQSRREDHEVVSIACPSCRYSLSVDPQTPEGKENPSYNGDRIIVAKFPYDFSEPKRWDVIVFKYPAEAQTNFIKRLTGLPGETIRISGGDLYVAQGEAEFDIARKPPTKAVAMAQLVSDNDHLPADLLAAGWPARWGSWPAKASPAKTGWRAVEEGKSFQFAEGETEEWIRYQHFVPLNRDWQAVEAGEKIARAPKPQLITDHYAYNTSVPRRGAHHPSHGVGMHWAGDLMLECQAQVAGSAGQLMLDLVESGRHHRCTFDVAAGQAKLTIDGLPEFQPVAQTQLRGPGTYRLRLANFDDQLLLWVNDRVVEFSSPTTYVPPNSDRPRWTAEDPLDLAAAGIGSRGASVTVRHIRVLRDVYYIADTRAGGADPIADWPAPGALRLPSRPEDWAELFSDPEAWEPRGRDDNGLFGERQEAEFSLGADQFFVLGDNSPSSSDARLWRQGEQFVSRELLIGKALFIFWPHSFNRIPGTSIPFPMFPNVGDMGFVR